MNQYKYDLVPTLDKAYRFITKEIELLKSISNNFLIDCETSLLLPVVLDSSITVRYDKGTRTHALILVGGVLMASVRGGVRLRTLEF